MTRFLIYVGLLALAGCGQNINPVKHARQSRRAFVAEHNRRMDAAAKASVDQKTVQDQSPGDATQP